MHPLAPQTSSSSAQQALSTTRTPSSLTSHHHSPKFKLIRIGMHTTTSSLDLSKTNFPGLYTHTQFNATGLDDPDLLKDRTEVNVGTTPYGEVSDVLITGTISDVPCVLLARHGRK